MSTLGALVLGSALVVVEVSAEAVAQAAEARKQAALLKELDELRIENAKEAKAQRETMRESIEAARRESVGGGAADPAAVEAAVERYFATMS